MPNQQKSMALPAILFIFFILGWILYMFSDTIAKVGARFIAGGL